MEKGTGNKVQIPFGKAVRVHNFKLWRSRVKYGDATIEAVNASTLDGSWMTRIPSTVDMYGWICMSYSDFMDDDVTRKAQGEAVLTTVLSNMLYTSSIVNGYYQRALELCATVYAHPSLLDCKSKEHKGFVKDVKGLCSEFLKWRRGYDEYMKDNEPTEEQMHQDEIAEQALEALSSESKDSAV